MKSNKFIEFFAQQPVLWDMFELVFGSDKDKLKLYRSKVGNPKKMMDFGCSSGNVTGAFLDLDYTGVDIDKQLIIHARKKWKNYPNIKFIATDILRPNRKLGKFDVILFAGTGHHLPDELYLKVFQALNGYLKKGGIIHYIDTIRSSPSDSLFAKFMCLIDRGNYIRTKKHSMSLIKQLSKTYRVVSSSEEHISNTLMPHPLYLYVKLKSKIYSTL